MREIGLGVEKGGGGELSEMLVVKQVWHVSIVECKMAPSKRSNRRQAKAQGTKSAGFDDAVRLRGHGFTT